jgi:Holliday junction resolvase
MRRAAKIDDNQKKIVEQLRRCGVSVAVTSMMGKGFPDIIAGHNGVNYMIELKDGAKTASRRKLTEDEQEWHKKWKGKVHVADDIDDCLKIIGLI